MFFPSRIDPSHACVIGHAVYRQHVSRSACVDRMSIRITAEIIEAGDHRILQALIDDILPPEISHSILYPFKIRNGDASGVSQNVGDHKDTFLVKYFVRRGRGGPIRSFCQNLALDSIRVLRSNLILGGSRNKHVTLKLQELAVCYPFNPIKIFKRACGLKMLQRSWNVDAGRIVDASMDVRNRNDFITSLVKQQGTDAPDIPRSLDYDPRRLRRHPKPFYCFIDYE